MRQIPLSFVKEGYILGKSLYNESGQLLISKNTALTNSMIVKIRHIGFKSVFIASEYTEQHIEEVVKPEFIQRALLLNKRISSMVVKQNGDIHNSLMELS